MNPVEVFTTFAVPPSSWSGLSSVEPVVGQPDIPARIQMCLADKEYVGLEED